MVNIKACSIFNYTHGSITQKHKLSNFFTQNFSGQSTFGGAIIAINNDVEINNVTFEGNAAQIAAAIYICWENE